MEANSRGLGKRMSYWVPTFSRTSSPVAGGTGGCAYSIGAGTVAVIDSCQIPISCSILEIESRRGFITATFVIESLENVSSRSSACFKIDGRGRMISHQVSKKVLREVFRSVIGAFMPRRRSAFEKKNSLRAQRAP